MSEEDDDWEVDDDERSSEPDPVEASPETDTGEDIEKLRQKVRSAEGRFTKFEESLNEMRQQLSEKESVTEEATEPVSEPPPLPAGWTQSDWDDFCADNPVEAELIEAQSRQLRDLQQRVDTSEQQRQEQDYVQQFRSTVLGAHPDYDQLLKEQRDDINAFIDNQDNRLLKDAFRRVYEQGTAEEVVELVNQYKASKSNQTQPLNGDGRRLEQSLAIPSHSPVPDSHRQGGLPAEDDEDAAWDYFPDDAI